MLAQLTAAVVNFGFYRPQEPAAVEDFMLLRKEGEKQEPETDELTEERRQEIAAAWRRFAQRNAAT